MLQAPKFTFKPFQTKPVNTTVTANIPSSGIQPVDSSGIVKTQSEPKFSGGINNAQSLPQALATNSQGQAILESTSLDSMKGNWVENKLSNGRLSSITSNGPNAGLSKTWNRPNNSPVMRDVDTSSAASPSENLSPLRSPGFLKQPNTTPMAHENDHRGSLRRTLGNSSETAITATPNTNTNNKSMILSSSSSGYVPDPFQEVSKAMQVQTRRIKDLELQLKEQVFISDQLREKFAQNQDQVRSSLEEISNLKEILARTEKSSEYKDHELEVMRRKVRDLESDRTALVSDKVALAKSMTEEKKAFIVKLKEATETILILQGVKAKMNKASSTLLEGDSNVSSGNTSEAISSKEVTKININQDEHQNKEKLLTSVQENKDGNLSSEIENNYAELSHWCQVLIDIVQQCQVCNEKWMKAQIPTENENAVASTEVL